MILNNYWNYLNYVTKNDPPTTDNSLCTFGLVYDLFASGQHYKYRDNNTTGLNAAVRASTPANDSLSTWIIRKGLSVYVGHGTTEPTADDYVMEADDTSKFSNYSVSAETVCADGKTTTTFVITGTNNTNDDITISEVMIYKPVLTNYSTGYAYYTASIAFVHEILDNPVVVSPGEGLSLILSWEQG